MAGDLNKNQTIIIKRIKKGGHGHHGGAWKIAYADFVTAMMAFFLLMWLLGSTTEGDKKGIQDYFTAPLQVALLNHGSGSGDSSHILRGGGQDLTRTTGQVKRGEVAAPKDIISLQAFKEAQARAEMARLGELKKRVEQRIASSPAMSGLKNQIRIDLTADGLRIQIVDAEQRPMFDSGSALVQPYMREILREFAVILDGVPNRLTIEGHTDARPYASGVRGYSNWELSADRANASRRELVAGGLTEARMLRVQGLASSLPLEADNPAGPANRRISILVMNRAAEDRVMGRMGESVSSGDELAAELGASQPTR